MHELFEAQAGATPEAVALVWGRERLSYGELERRANRLAHHLRRHGVGAEARVGVLLERSTELVVSFLGVLKAGGAYVPLDPAYPAERLAFMLSDAGVRVLVTQGELGEGLPAHGVQRVCLDTDAARIAAEPSTRVGAAVGPENLCYVIYTSGSTGTPKGVMVPHGGIANLAHTEIREFEIGPGDRILQFASISFDVSIMETTLALCSGGTLCPVPAHAALPGPLLIRWLRESRVTIAAFTPSTLSALPQEPLPQLRIIFLGGEPCPPALVSAWAPGRRLVSAYGPTEATVQVTTIECTEDGRQPPIGRPIPNTRAYVLESQLGPSSPGVTGELYVGGAGVARGYLGRPDLTAERFVPDPLSGEPGARLYRTGDRVLRRADGVLEFVGRADEQVKIRGHRVELGEVESVLRRSPGVRDAVVAVRDDTGERKVVAYIVSNGGPAPSPAALRGFLAKRLPEYMLPEVFVGLDRLPTGPTGKVDRRRLPTPDLNVPEPRCGLAVPATRTEQALLEIWTEVLGAPRVGVEDSFFDLGGHSLAATQVLSRIRDVFQVEVRPSVLFENTIASLAPLIDREREERVGSLEGHSRLLPRRSQSEARLSFAQERLWFLNHLVPDCAFYNIPAAYRLTGPLNVEALYRALKEVVVRHEALRTTFAERDGTPVQIISPPAAFTLIREDFSTLPAGERQGAARRWIEAEARRPFDLVRGPLFRAALLRLDAQQHMLLLCLHHITSDVWSMGVLLRELTALYPTVVRGEPSPLEELQIQYVDYALWQREHLSGEAAQRDLAWWTETLDGAPDLLELPADRPRPVAQSHRGALHHFRLSPRRVEPLRALAQQEGTTLFMVLLAAWKVLLARYSGQTDLVVGTPTAGRMHSETEGLVGFFVNTLLLRTDLSGDPTLRELLARVREVTGSAYDHQELPFERLVQALRPERSLAHTPLFQILFQLLNTPITPTEPLRVADLLLEPFAVDTGTARFDLELHLVESGGGLDGVAEYSTDLFDAATVERMEEHYRVLLEGIAAHPEARLSELPLLGPAERDQVLVRWNATAAAYPRERCLHELFEAQAGATPEAVALVWGRERLSYAELERRANRLAHYLRRHGVGAETRVGVLLERSTELVVSLLAILKAGGAYVPLDPAYPAERLAFMLSDAGVRVLVTQGELGEGLPAHGVQRVCLDTDAERIAAEPGTNPDGMEVGPENLCYVIYTSGSTGTPKGVAIEHRSPVALVHWAAGVFDADDLAGVLASTSVCFDLSVFELFLTLGRGGTVILAENALHLETLPARAEVRLVNTVPSAMRQLLDMGGIPHSVRTANLAGEPLPTALVNRIYQETRVQRVFDLYGPSEDTTYSTFTLRIAGAPATIGQPIANGRAYVLDAHGNPAPVGVPGELYLGGDGVARGYLGRPALTAERFVPDPFSGEAGARLYRTGDRVRWLAGGELEFLGRLDQQVKVRGFRIEPGEIEAALLGCPAVREAVVLAREDNPGDCRLVAYVTADADAEAWQRSEADQVGEWREVFEEAYGGPAPEADPTFNIQGWNSSYTGEPIPPDQMREWVEQTVARIRERAPRRVLEIGCGTGLLLFRIAPRCTAYVGTDFSPRMLEVLRAHLPAFGLEQTVRLLEREADNFTGLGRGSFDAVVINSVAQYFPDAEYLLRVINGAVEIVQPGGFIFLGDLRNGLLLGAFHASVACSKAAPSGSAAELRREVEYLEAQENELVVDPAFFHAIRDRFPRITHVEVLPKRGDHANELIRFRYDVVLHVESTPAEPVPVWLDWTDEELTIQSLRERLAREQPDALGITRIPNARVEEAAALFERLTDDACPETVEALRIEAAAASDSGVDPEELWGLTRDFPYAAHLSWGRCDRRGRFDAVFRRRSSAGACDRDIRPVAFLQPEVREAYHSYANDPLRARIARELVPVLRDRLAAGLPEHMVPDSIEVLPELPLTPNGKVDRRALPAPGQIRTTKSETLVAPRTGPEQILTEIWTELLGVVRIGVYDDFFELGGHSLLATQVISRVRDRFQLRLTLGEFFAAPRIADLALVVEDKILAEIEALSDSDAHDLLSGSAGATAGGFQA